MKVYFGKYTGIELSRCPLKYIKWVSTRSDSLSCEFVAEAKALIAPHLAPGEAELLERIPVRRSAQEIVGLVEAELHQSGKRRR